MDEDILRDKARAVVQSGKLPRCRPDRTWGGPGVGAECAVCGLPVAQDELELEIQFAHDGDNPGLWISFTSMCGALRRGNSSDDPAPRAGAYPARQGMWPPSWWPR
jgi:hypothetical protein